MKKIALVLAAALLSAPAAFAAETAGTWKGEVLDLACFIGHGKKGPGHAACAKTCVKGGQPMGLLTTDGKVLLLAADHANEKPYKAAQDLAGKNVEIKGTMAQGSGISMVTVSEVAAAK
jgi:hypothetical protein